MRDFTTPTGKHGRYEVPGWVESLLWHRNRLSSAIRHHVSLSHKAPFHWLQNPSQWLRLLPKGEINVRRLDKPVAITTELYNTFGSWTKGSSRVL